MIIFQNPGLIEEAAITTLGISVKDDEGSAIGRFGTGLKFAIATILRHGGSIVVWRGTEPLRFTSRLMEVRGKEFEQVCLNDAPLGFTTQLGRDWEPWMAFRELASNCRDEMGRYWQDRSDQPYGWFAAEETTTITVTGKAFEDVWNERHLILLETQPLAQSAGVDIHHGVSQHIYYRGVRVHKLTRPTVFTYNILDEVSLTEDRTAASWYELESQLERSIGAMEDHNMLRDVLTCGETYTEHHVDVPRFGRPGPAYREVTQKLALGGETILNLNPKAAAFARKSALSDIMPGDDRQMSMVERTMLRRAVDALEAAGFAIREFPVISIDTLGPGIIGLAQDGKIFLSKLAFEKGTREVAATLLEEYAHLKSGAGDCTRPFQNWLFDQLLIQVEQRQGEPF